MPLVDVIVNGTQLLPSLDSLSSSRLSLHLRVGDEEETLYSAVSVWSGDLQIAPSGCTNPPQAMLLPGEDKGDSRHYNNNFSNVFCSLQR